MLFISFPGLKYGVPQFRQAISPIAPCEIIYKPLINKRKTKINF